MAGLKSAVAVKNKNESICEQKEAQGKHFQRTFAHKVKERTDCMVTFVHAAAILLLLQPWQQFSVMSSSYMVDLVSIGSRNYEADFHAEEWFPIGNYHLGQLIWQIFQINLQFFTD